MGHQYSELAFLVSELDECSARLVELAVIQLTQRAFYFCELLGLVGDRAFKIPLVARITEPKSEISHSCFAPPQMAIDENANPAIEQMFPQPSFKMVMNESGELRVKSASDGEVIE